MIKLLVSNTHSKFVYDDHNEKKEWEKYIKEKLTVEDPKLLRDPLVLRGIKSSKVCFYDEEHQIIPSGLVPHVKIYAKKENYNLIAEDLRKFPKPNSQVKEEIENGTFSFGKPLRDSQVEGLQNIIKYKGGIVESATGSGKSLMMACVCKLYDKQNILIVFNRVELLDQTYKAFISYGIPKEDLGVVGGGKYDDEKRITLLTMQSYPNIYHLFPKIKIIITDECHETGRAPTAEKIIYSCQNAPIKLGFSATVQTMDNEYEKYKLYGNIGPVIYKKEYYSLRDEGILADVKVTMYQIGKEEHIPVHGSWNDVYENIKIKDSLDIPAYEKKGYEIVKQGSDTVARKFVEYGDESRLYIFNEKRNKKIAEIANKHERVLILFSKIAHGKELKKLLPNAILVSGETDRLGRDSAKKEIEKNPNAIVIASGIFSTGVDLPSIKNLIFAGSSVSTTKVIQEIGRSTRKAAGKLSAMIHDFLQENNALSRKQSLKRKKIYEDLKIEVKIK